MNYTTNYHLPQWVESDRILMGDFNEAMETLDGGIAAAKAAADTAKTTADAAQDAAEAAQSSADAAQSTADNAYCPDNKPYVIGTYRGSRSETKITLGFQPSCLIIGKVYGSGSAEDSYGACSVFFGGRITDVLEIEADGFTLFPNTLNIYPSVNWVSNSYFYIAFR